MPLERFNRDELLKKFAVEHGQPKRQRDPSSREWLLEAINRFDPQRRKQLAVSFLDWRAAIRVARNQGYIYLGDEGAGLGVREVGRFATALRQAFTKNVVTDPESREALGRLLVFLEEHAREGFRLTQRFKR
jgi:hypothetical protein